MQPSLARREMAVLVDKIWILNSHACGTRETRFLSHADHTFVYPFTSQHPVVRDKPVMRYLITFFMRSVGHVPLSTTLGEQREARRELAYGCKTFATLTLMKRKSREGWDSVTCANRKLTYTSNVIVCAWWKQSAGFSEISEKKTRLREMSTHCPEDETRHTRPWLLWRRGAGDDYDDHYDNDDVDADACY